MQIFVWKAVAKNGVVQKGELVAGNQAVVVARLRKQGYQNIVVTGRRKKGGVFQSNRVNERDIVIFLRQLSVMVSAGIPLVTCFAQVGRGSEKPVIHEISLRIRDYIELGQSLSNAMAKEPLLFDDFTVNLVRVAEKSGVLGVVLERLATYKEKSFILKGKIKSALIYPIAVLTLACLIFYLLMVKVVPVFVSLFESFDVALPTATQWLITISDFTRAYWWVVLLGVVVLSNIFSFRYRRSDSFHYRVDDMLLSLPVFGDLIRKAAVARFARSFSTMLAAGTPILSCLDAVANTAGNRVVAKVLRESEAAIAAGRSLSEPLEESEIFPPLVTQMIFVGETSGNLDFMLNKIADFYDEEVDRAVDNVKSLIEPLIMVILGIMIGSIVLGMYLPLLQMGAFVG